MNTKKPPVGECMRVHQYSNSLSFSIVCNLIRTLQVKVESTTNKIEMGIVGVTCLLCEIYPRSAIAGKIDHLTFRKRTLWMVEHLMTKYCIEYRWTKV